MVTVMSERKHMVRGKLWGCNVRVNYRFLKVFHEKQSALFRLIEYELQNVQFVKALFLVFSTLQILACKSCVICSIYPVMLCFVTSLLELMQLCWLYFLYIFVAIFLTF